MTKEEAEYLEALGFVPSSWSASCFVLSGLDGSSPAIVAVIERTPYSHKGPGEFLWNARTPIARGRLPVKMIGANDLISLVVMAKLEEIF